MHSRAYSCSSPGRDAQRLDDTAQQCRDAGASVSTWAGDVTDERGLRDWIYACDAQQPLNLVIANAGVALGAADVQGLHRAAVDSFDINVRGVFNTVHPALEVMSSRPYPVTDAQVALMSSVMGYAGMARSPAYSTSKAAVKHYGQALRGAFRGMGIGVCVICPGYVGSALTARNTSKMPFLMPADKAARIIARGIGPQQTVHHLSLADGDYHSFGDQPAGVSRGSTQQTLGRTQA